MKHNYERLKVYHSSMELARECYDIDAVDKGKQLTDHIFKTSFSVPSNIAEGSQRKTNADFLRFLNYSASSCAELTCQLSLAMTIKGTNKEKVSSALKKSKEVSKQIWGLIHKLQEESKP